MVIIEHSFLDTSIRDRYGNKRESEGFCHIKASQLPSDMLITDCIIGYTF